MAKKALTIRMEEKALQTFKAWCKATGETQDSIIHQALSEYMSNHGLEPRAKAVFDALMEQESERRDSMTFENWCGYKRLEKAMFAYDGIYQAVKRNGADDAKLDEEIREGMDTIADLVAQYRNEGGNEPLGLIVASIRKAAQYDDFKVDKVPFELFERRMS